ncbi:hypothetical protein SNS2_5279 [Streptomyces netropsis]|uniref:Uncharacterized protein n=1 Tax=Streptomyces syringium TaxID=76729 RepID=A0ABS4YCB9_9ACTN|nr:hypothetical protein [Streptomyces syringium]SPE63955.1 hypothetical protein SNS2_5279 [Streptomyces netropsis]
MPVARKFRVNALTGAPGTDDAGSKAVPEHEGAPAHART